MRIVKRLFLLVIIIGASIDATFGQENKYEKSYKSYLEKVNKYIQVAQNKLPYVKEKFNSEETGNADFYVVTILRDSVGRWEQVYLQVDQWDENIILTTLSSHMNVVKGYDYGANFVIEEEKVIDWLIIYPKGKKEGNFIVRNLKSESN